MPAKISLDQPCTYRIRVQGNLDAGWADYFDDMQFTASSAPDGSPITTLMGTLVDQAAMQGVLQKLYSLGFPLISVEKLD
jgi:hypothetical protein